MPYDYPSWSGLGVAVIPDRAFGDVTRSAPVNIADTLQLPTAIISPIVATASAPTPSQVVTGTPGANMGVVSTTAPATPDQISIGGVAIDFANPVTWVFLGAGALAVIVPKSTGMKVGLLAAIAFAYYEVGTMSSF